MSNRRKFLNLCATMTITLNAPLLLGCAQRGTDPQPFKSGKEISPPLGCTELRKTDPRGDC